MSVPEKFDGRADEIRIEILSLLDETFDSHEFIQTYAQKHEIEYIELLSIYKSFQKCHTAIGRWLSQNNGVLDIRSQGKRPSKNIFGQTNNVEVWKKE